MRIQAAFGMLKRLSGKIKSYGTQALTRKEERVEPCAAANINGEAASGKLGVFPPKLLHLRWSDAGIPRRLATAITPIPVGP